MELSLDRVYFSCHFRSDLTHVYPAMTDIPVYQNKADFTINTNGEKTRVALVMRKRVAELTHQYYIHRITAGDGEPGSNAELSSKLICASIHPAFNFTPGEEHTHFLVTCMVTFPPPKPVFPPKDDVFAALLDYCERDPELMMAFECDGTPVKAVTGVMVSRSPVIDTMMKTNCVESRTRVVKIVDFSARVMSKFVEFCQTNEIKDSVGCEMDLYRVADKYDVGQLKESAVTLIENSISVVNVVQVYQFAVANSLNGIQYACIKMGSSKWNGVSGFAEVTDIPGAVLKRYWQCVKEFRWETPHSASDSDSNSVSSE